MSNKQVQEKARNEKRHDEMCNGCGGVRCGCCVKALRPGTAMVVALDSALNKEIFPLSIG